GGGGVAAGHLVPARLQAAGPRPGGRQAPPPLWGRGSAEEGPPIPFWLRPVDPAQGEPGRDE
ncbi:hypothetical protein, partial [Actinomadura roseirufa]|uniref:hypothetical protein n=1 Tax=Actinomadura roseirufa TaxID=2094049 RepID=UPI001A954654